jgi:hypothetical protein
MALIGMVWMFWYANTHVSYFDRWAFFLAGGAWALFLVVTAIGTMAVPVGSL